MVVPIEAQKKTSNMWTRGVCEEIVTLLSGGTRTNQLGRFTVPAQAAALCALTYHGNRPLNTDSTKKPKCKSTPTRFRLTRAHTAHGMAFSNSFPDTNERKTSAR
jgi:hypothetical protein